jgi:aspartyl-tRNA(Asn)/glutamyl-tRNA(Gln) amidotransferase subunit B
VILQGSLRCDVNVSVNRAGENPGNRCEIKNLNSVKFAQVAISSYLMSYSFAFPRKTHCNVFSASEVLRQIALLERGEVVQQETRGFDEDTASTISLRSKEDAPDYRYMPDPNLPPLLLSEVCALAPTAAVRLKADDLEITVLRAADT